MTPAPTSRSASNTIAQASPLFTNTKDSWKRNIEREKVYQVGHPLLVPEQPSVGFEVVYTYDNMQFHSRVNVPAGTWQSGHQYIYTLVFSKAAGGIGLKLKTIHLSASGWDDSIAEFNESSTVETRLALEVVSTYRRYDEDDNLVTWTDSYLAVAPGVDGSGELLSPCVHLFTTSASALELISDNSYFRFLRYVPGVGPAAESETSLTIASGTDVETLFYVVPSSALLPESEPDRKANIYLRDTGTNTLVPYNAGYLPGNDTNTACQFYVVTPSVYTSGTTAEHMYDVLK